MKTLTILIPAYNEEKTIEESLTRLSKLSFFQKAIVINDSSNDKTEEIVSNFLKQDSRFSLIRTEKNMGKGKALGIAQKIIDTELVVIHDADLEYFPEDLVEMYSLANKHDNSLILGSRFIGTKKRKNIYKRTYIANKAISIFFSIVNMYKVTDVASCYKMMTSTFFKKMDIKENGFSIEIEILSKYLKFNRSIKEVPIQYEARSYSEGKKIKSSDGIFYLLSTIKYKFLD
ncbi:MAG: glycosyltransferase family 2 protein [Candidatus Marinimicrobia bacterium]|nr:glycosyltransferase family 2 protein [Candidatus Neomarinimicrobiota bacterium]MDA1364130.1 glycosyltransferase family 2 protein [Candidatus Neomarinimicrobiota bacterium]